MKTLEKKREQRYASMSDLLNALEQILPRLSDAPTPCSRLSRPAPIPRSRRSHRHR